ncbi:MAG: hypothetical protein ACK56I_13560, partial [bacterium]
MPQQTGAADQHPQHPQSVEQHVQRFCIGAQPGLEPFPLVQLHQDVGRVPSHTAPIPQQPMTHARAGRDQHGCQHEGSQAGMQL